jgi:Fe-S cluster assembly protein SufB
MAAMDLDLGRYQLGWSDTEDYVFKPQKGLDESIVREMSAMKGEPDWMRDFRLNALKRFERKPLFPLFRGMGERIERDLGGLDFNDIYYYVKPTESQVKDWNDLPDSIKNTYEKLGIPEAERKYLSGVTAQYESEVVFHRNRADLEEQGVLFCDMDTAVREYPEIVQKWFGTLIPPGDNKFAALNSAVWSGGSFIYVPPGVTVEMPLQAYFRINTENMGQFERTLIIADEGSQVHYIEGCSAPVYSTDSLHSAVVELVALAGSRITYTTIQNWSNNVYNLVTKRARAEAEAHVEWIDGNIGSRLTMKYPSVYLMGPKASGEVLSVAYAGPGQHQDAGAKMIHAAPETTSTIVSKSISKGGGTTTYRGTVHVDEGAKGAKAFVRCDALLLDEESVSETKPYMEVGERDARIGHEATVSKVGDEQLFYLMSRGLSEGQAMSMIVNGFIEPITRTLPMEYAVEWSRLIELQMEGSVG